MTQSEYHKGEAPNQLFRIPSGPNFGPITNQNLNNYGRLSILPQSGLSNDQKLFAKKSEEEAQSRNSAMPPLDPLPQTFNQNIQFG